MLTRSFTCLSKYARSPNHRFRSSSVLDIEKLESESMAGDLQEDEEQRAREEGIQRRRNKSRLSQQHYNIVNNRPPYAEPSHWSHGTLKYQRKIYGTYGSQSNFDASLCWNKEEIAKQERYEKVAYPKSVLQLLHEAKERRQARNANILKHQEDIHAKMQKVQTWTEELHMKIAKKESEALAAKQRKDKLIEEVRRHFGFTVDAHDERFKEMLEKKEKEQRKAMKETRKKAKEQALMQKLAAVEKNEQKQLEDDDDETKQA